MSAGWSRVNFPVTSWPHLTERKIHHIRFESLQTTTDPLTLTSVIQAGVITDGFLNGVLESVKDSDNIFFEISSLTPMTYCAINDQKMYVLVSVYQVQVAKQSCARLMGTASWRDILVLIGRMKRFPMHITGQICSPTWHILYGLVRCALHPKVQINCVWGPNLSHSSHFNLLQVGLWIWLDHYQQLRVDTHGLSLGWTVHPK